MQVRRQVERIMNSELGLLEWFRIMRVERM